MDRRRFLAIGTAALASLAGCSARSGVAPTASGTAVRVTTSTAEGIEFLVAQIAIAPDAAGPDAYYRLRNTADADATVRVETELVLEGGGTYSAFAVVTVPAGDTVTVRYRLVSFDELTDAEADQIRSGEGVEFTVILNGRAQPGV